MEYTVKIHKKNKTLEKKAKAGTNLLKFMRENSLDVNASCGGHGTCGKCKVLTGLSDEPSGKEKELLGGKAVEKGYRLACYNKINSDMELFIGEKPVQANIATEGKERDIKLEPLVTKKYFELGSPGIHDQRPDLERVLDLCRKGKDSVAVEALRELPGILRDNDFKVTLVSVDKKLVSVEPGDTSKTICGIAVDIGTTTVVGYLVDLTTGKKVDVYPLLNPQKKFGADVISRINHTMESRANLNEMNKVIIDCINQIVKYFTSKNRIKKTDIYAITFVGNTTMLHFLLKLPAKNIAVSPFIPVTTQMHKLRAKDLGLDINPSGCALVYPAVSAYVGADTVAAVLSSGMYENEEISLLIDLGTNGEIVLGSNKWMYSCSAAAGPAFEGANIRNGVGGINGAIDKITVNPELSISTIGNEKPLGICGSGVVDAVAEMLTWDIIDETGRLTPADEADSLPENLLGRLTVIDGINSFLLLKSEDCSAGMDIAITQKDIRELQNAKAAIAAGIRILAKNAGIALSDIGRVYLAGGFGSYINVKSAVKIGLLPPELDGRIESIGNAAGTGAVEGLVSRKMLKKAVEIKEKIKYIELSSNHDFMDEYVDCMMF